VEAGTLQIKHRSMADSVTDRMRQLIISRTLRPGQRIRQAELATMLGVSVMPIRESLLRLVVEGLVIADANRSYTVAPLTPASIRDLYWIHSILASELTARAWDHRSDELIASLHWLHKQYGAALRSNDHAALEEANFEFHKQLHHAAEAPTIAYALRNTMHYFPDFSSQIDGWPELADGWQAGILKAFVTGSRNSAREVAESNIKKAAGLFIHSYWSTDVISA
jgi:DNA-binding GntR family transcriptional regulator